MTDAGILLVGGVFAGGIGLLLMGLALMFFVYQEFKR